MDTNGLCRETLKNSMDNETTLMTAQESESEGNFFTDIYRERIGQCSNNSAGTIIPKLCRSKRALEEELEEIISGVSSQHRPKRLKHPKRQAAEVARTKISGILNATAIPTMPSRKRRAKYESEAYLAKVFFLY